MSSTWNIDRSISGFDSLVLGGNNENPKPGSYEVLVKFRAASLNHGVSWWRQVSCPNARTKNGALTVVGQYSYANRDGVVPGSDAAGEIVSLGLNVCQHVHYQEVVTNIAQVTRFRVGGRAHTLFTQGHYAGDFTPKLFSAGLGGARDGVFRRYGVFNEEGLILIPEEISYEEAATLPCAAVTVWNALYGLRQLLPGDVVLTQGTGGVSLFVLQFAKAAGATVICTTSSTEKADVLRTQGADHVVVYEHNLDWVQLAKTLTPQGRDVDHVVDVGGASTIDQSLKAGRIGGVVHMIGFLGGRQGGPSCLEVFLTGCILRSVIVGSRERHEQCVSSSSVL